MKFLFPILGILVSLTPLRAETSLLAVDFNAGARTPTPTMDGFQPFDVTVADATGPLGVSFPVKDTFYSGPVTVTVTTGKSEDETGRMTGRLCTMDPAMANLPIGALYYDAICSADGKPLLVSITGLRSGKSYKLDFFAFTSTRAGQETFTDITTGDPGDAATVEWNDDFQFSESTPENQFEGSLTGKADASGKMIISITNKQGSPLLSGLRISESKP